MTKYEAIIVAVKKLGLRASTIALQKMAADIHREQNEKLIDNEAADVISRQEYLRIKKEVQKRHTWENVIVHSEIGRKLAYQLWYNKVSDHSVSYMYCVSARKAEQRRRHKVYDLRTLRDVPGRNMIEPIAA